MRTDYTNLGHLSDTEIDICECDDPQCPSCAGQCHDHAIVTMYRIDQQDETGTRMCHNCSVDAYEAGVFESDDND